MERSGRRWKEKKGDDFQKSNKNYVEDLRNWDKEFGAEKERDCEIGIHWKILKKEAQL